MSDLAMQCVKCSSYTYTICTRIVIVVENGRSGENYGKKEKIKIFKNFE